MIQKHQKSYPKSKKRMILNSIKRFFLICSGADLAILSRKDCKCEHNKYAGIGSAVFFTALFAAISGGFALFKVFENCWISLAFGGIWGCFIFSLDRFIVSTLKKESGIYFQKSAFLNGVFLKSIELFKASPRIFLAIILALVISKPLELKIFEREINAKVVVLEEQTKQEKEQAVRDRFEESLKRKNAQLNLYEQEVRMKETEKSRLQDEATKESDGTGGSKIRNMGPIYRQKKDLADRANVEYIKVRNKNQPVIDQTRKEIQDIESRVETEIGKLEHEPYNGLLASIAALNILTQENQGMYWADLAIFLLFICIELAPLIFKILTDKGIYDTILAGKEEVVHSKETERISEINDDINRRIKLKIGETQNVVSQELTSNRQLLEKISNAQLELADEIIQMWKKKELEKIRNNPPEYLFDLRKAEAAEENGIPS